MNIVGNESAIRPSWAGYSGISTSNISERMLHGSAYWVAFISVYLAHASDLVLVLYIQCYISLYISYSVVKWLDSTTVRTQDVNSSNMILNISV